MRLPRSIAEHTPPYLDHTSYLTQDLLALLSRKLALLRLRGEVTHADARMGVITATCDFGSRLYKT